MRGVGCGVWGLGFEVWGSGFWVWGMGFGVWGVGLREKCAFIAIDGVHGRDTTRAEDVQGTPTQRHIAPSIPVYED